MKRYNISVPKKYEKDGEEKTQWNNVGTLVHFEASEGKEEGYRLELHMFPGQRFFVFEQKPKDERERSNASEPKRTGEINPDDVPF